MPTESPPSVRPVIFAAPRIVVLVRSVNRLVRAERRRVRGSLTDAAGVEELVEPLDREAQDLLALQEERPFLRVKSLVRGEVDDRGVRLDLSDSRGSPVTSSVKLDVRPIFASSPADAETSVPPAPARSGSTRPEDMRQKLHVTRTRQVADTVQLAELVHASGVLPRDELPLDSSLLRLIHRHACIPQTCSS